MSDAAGVRVAEMEPDVQKLAVTALVGLALLFPVFNQVTATSLEALTNADHQAKWKNLLKNWDDIPEDEKLAYWDGRNRPPGDGGDFDEDRIDDDVRIGDPQPQPQPGDRDGDGVPDESDVDPDDANETAQRPFRWVTVQLWACPCNTNTTSNYEVPAGLSIGEDGRTYQFVNVSFGYTGFSGTYDFELRSGSDLLWQVGTDGLPEVSSDRPTQDDVNPSIGGRMTVYPMYDPIGGPQSFQLVITGAYREYLDDA